MDNVRFIFIEPHGDDAWLSASTLLLRSKDSLLLTMSSRSSEKLAEVLSRPIETKFYDLPEIHLNLRPKINTYDIHRAYVNKRFTEMWDIYHTAVMEADSLQSAYDEALRALFVTATPSILGMHEEMVNQGCTPIYVLPVGLDHPYHELITRNLSSILPEESLLYYADKPYIQKRYIREIMDIHPVTRRTALVNHTVYDRVTIPIGNIDYKETVFRTVYPTETSLLRFSNVVLLEDPEEFYWNSELVTRVLKEMKIV